MTTDREPERLASFPGIHRPAAGRSRATVVLLHGIADSGECWTAVAERLDPGYELLMPDACGHGTAPLPDGSVDLATLAGDVIDLIEDRRSAVDADEGRVVLVGHSMGAATAAHVAAHRPDLVQRLVLEDPPWFDAPPEVGARHPDWLRDLRDLDHYARVAAGRSTNPTWSDAELEPWARSKAQVDLAFFDRYERTSMYDWEQLVERLEVPTLLITGEPDRGALVTAEVAARVVALTSEARVLHLDEAGHSTRRDRPDAFVNGLAAFLEEQAG